MKKPPFVENQIYHIYNRGVEKRDIFVDSQDYIRFIHCLFVLNDQFVFKNFNRIPMSEVGPNSLERGGEIEISNIQNRRKSRELLVEILVFSLMPNHFHLMIRQLVDGGVVKFMRKLGTAHAMYFNQKYNRVGSLFQGNFKAKLVERDAHFLYLPHYIHLNSLALLNELGPTSLIEKMKFLEKYRWSSFPDYVGKKNFPSVTQRDFLLETFGGIDGYRKDIETFLKTEKKNSSLSDGVLFEK